MRMSVEEFQALLMRNPALRARITWNLGKEPGTDFHKNKSAVEAIPIKDRFDSEAERRYYYKYISPGEKNGTIHSLELHKTFEIVPALENNSRKYRAIRYSPDFSIEYGDGRIEIVEVKGRKIKKLRPDYPIRRQLFIQNHCNPNGWIVTEVFDDEI